MSKSLALLLVLVLAASAIVSALPVKAEARTIVVPDDYATISLAIENALDGDTVFVKKGTYQESTLEIRKTLLLIGEEVDGTILNLDPPLVEAIILYNRFMILSTAITINANNVKLQGFTVNIPQDDYGYGGGLHANGDRIEVINNKITNNSVYLSGSSISVAENSIADTLEVIGSNQTIANNSIQKSLNIQGSYNKITGNRINSLFNLIGSSNFISGNSFFMLEMENSNSNFIIENFFECLELEERGQGCSGNLIAKNRITGNGGFNSGIWVGSGSNNTVTANTIRDCDSGLRLTGAVTETSVYLNNFINNTINIQYYGDADWTLNTRFDNGKKGNYYDDYTGADNNWDGIGDVPYTIKGTRWDSEAGGVVDAGFGQDRYPLMVPFDIDSVAIELPEWASLSLDSSPSLNPIPEQTPTPTPYQEPTQTEQIEPILDVAIVVAVIIVAVGAGLLVYFRKRKR
jgi:nitrous oxidase accessory protein